KLEGCSAGFRRLDQYAALLVGNQHNWKELSESLLCNAFSAAVIFLREHGANLRSMDLKSRTDSFPVNRSALPGSVIYVTTAQPDSGSVHLNYQRKSRIRELLCVPVRLFAMVY